MPKFVCLRDFSKNPHGSTVRDAVTPLSRYNSCNFHVLSEFPRPRLSGNISPEVTTPLSVPLTVEMVVCATSTAHYHRTCRPLYPSHTGHDYPNFSFNLLLMTFYEYQTAGWSQKTTLHHVIMMGETYSRDLYISQYSSRVIDKNYLPPEQRRKIM